MLKTIIKASLLVWLLYTGLCWLALHGYISPMYTISFI